MANMKRRKVLAAMGTLPLAEPLLAAGTTVPKTTAEMQVAAHPLSANKFDYLRNDARARTEYLQAVREVKDYLLSDPAARAAFLESCDPMMLTMLYNANRATLEPVVGAHDGRTKDGRLMKIIHAAELFEGASGTDNAGLGTTGEELQIYASSSSSSSSSSSCSGCDIGGTLLGCCIIHFWGWTSGGSCSPCKGDVMPELQYPQVPY
jgi:hypothetical protein